MQARIPHFVTLNWTLERISIQLQLNACSTSTCTLAGFWNISTDFCSLSFTAFSLQRLFRAAKLIVWNLAEEWIILYFVPFGTAVAAHCWWNRHMIQQDSHKALGITRDHLILILPHVTQGKVITTQLKPRKEKQVTKLSERKLSTNRLIINLMLHRP